jgi:predicted RNA-binding protein with TRAM domain
LGDVNNTPINGEKHWRERLISPRKRSPRNAKNKRDRGGCPLIIGEEYEVGISQMSPSGEGIASVKGVLILIGNVKIGDHVKVKITNIDSVSAYAEITNRV